MANQHRYREVDVTPELARKWLDTNEENRRVSEDWVRKLARDMANDSFPLVGETIKFDEDGCLIDGQHRLLAVIAARVTMRFPIVEGIERKNRRFMDKPRTRKVSDSLTMEANIPSSKLAVAAARIVMMWEIEEIKSETLRPTDPEIYDFIVDNRELINQAVRYAIRARYDLGALPSPIAALYFLTYRISAAEAIPFWDAVASGAGLNEGDPELTLRNAITRMATKGGEKPTKPFLAMLAKAWNTRRQGKKMKVLAPKPTSELTDASFRLL